MEPAASVYAVIEETLPRWRRAVSWAGSLLLGAVGDHVLSPPARRWFVTERATGRIALTVTEGFEEHHDIGRVLARELDELTVEEFQEAWLPPAGPEPATP